MKPVICLEMWGSNHPVTGRNIPEERSSTAPLRKPEKKTILMLMHNGMIKYIRTTALPTCFLQPPPYRCYKRIQFVERVIRFGSVWRRRASLAFPSSSTITEKISSVQLATSLPSSNRCATFFFSVTNCFCHYIHFWLCYASERYALVRSLSARSGVCRVFGR